MRLLASIFALLALLASARAEPLEVLETPAFAIRATVMGPKVEALGLDEIATEAVMLPIRIPGEGDFDLDALIVAPKEAKAGDKRPAIVISHGNPRDPAYQRQLRIHRYSHLAEEFARRGYIAVVIARRGFARSSGEYDEWYGTCEGVDAAGYVRGGSVGAQDYRAALAAIAADPRVDPERLMTMGTSGGGFASLALAADPPPGLRGVINFSGGRGSAADGQNCNAEALQDAFASFGTPGAAPSLWLYSTSDRYFWPEMVKGHFANFGGPARLVTFGPIAHAADGHRLFQRGATHDWRPAIDAFLNDIFMPTWEEAPDDPVSLIDLSPDGLQEGGPEAFREFEGSEMNRAFAVGPAGEYGWGSAYASKEAAIEAAQKACRKEREIACSPYMVNERLR